MSEREGEGKEDGHGVRYGAGYGDGVGVGLGVGLGGGGIGGGIGSERGGRDSAEIERQSEREIERRREEGRVLRRAKSFFTCGVLINTESGVERGSGSEHAARANESEIGCDRDGASEREGERGRREAGG